MENLSFSERIHNMTLDELYEAFPRLALDESDAAEMEMIGAKIGQLESQFHAREHDEIKKQLDDHYKNIFEATKESQTTQKWIKWLLILTLVVAIIGLFV